jgi:hypothetical protein
MRGGSTSQANRKLYFPFPAFIEECCLSVFHYRSAGATIHPLGGSTGRIKEFHDCLMQGWQRHGWNLHFFPDILFAPLGGILINIAHKEIFYDQAFLGKYRALTAAPTTYDPSASHST